MPDLDLGGRRVFALLHEARPILLSFGAPLDVGAWSDRVRVVDARYEGAWELPVIGRVAAPNAVLIRPDGYVAWVGAGSDAGWAGALAMWFGAAGSTREGIAERTVSLSAGQTLRETR